MVAAAIAGAGNPEYQERPAAGRRPPVPLRAFDDRPSTFDPVLNVIGLGKDSEDKPDIDFRERPKLVVPQGNRPAAPPVRARRVSRNADWPIDSEVRAAQKREEDHHALSSRAPMTTRADNGRVLTPAELSTRGTTRNDSSGTNPNANDAQSTPQGLGIPTINNLFRRAAKGDQELPLEFKGEPEAARPANARRRTGYRDAVEERPFRQCGAVKSKRAIARVVDPNMPDYSGTIRTPANRRLLLAPPAEAAPVSSA